MNSITVSREDFEKIRGLARRSGDYWMVFSTNYKEEIWPTTSLGLNPVPDREHVQGCIQVLDQIVQEYLRVRGSGGRFFVSERGVYYKDEPMNETKFLEITITDRDSN
jgi:hypothetical protein